MAIIALTAVVLLDQRMAIVRDAGRSRDMRTAWILASQKMAELELDKTLWTGLGSQSNGDFGDVNPDYAPIQWEYQIVRETVELPDPTAAAENPNDKKKREVYRLTLTLRTPGNDDPIVLEGEFTVTPPKPEGSGATDDPSKTGTADPSKPPDPAAAPPATGGLKK